jgi:hypothetical protein
MEKNSYSAVKADRQPDKMLKCILNGISMLKWILFYGILIISLYTAGCFMAKGIFLLFNIHLTTNIKINLNSARYMEIIH